MALRAFFEVEPARVWICLAAAPQPANAIVISYSENGFLVEAEPGLAIGSSVEVVFSDTQMTTATITWAGPGLLGCLFGEHLSSSQWDNGIEAWSAKPDPNSESVRDRRARDNSLGERLKRLRTQKGLPQNVIATALGVSNAAISQWEADRTVPRPSRLVTLAGLFGVPLAELTEISANPDGPTSTSVEAMRAQLAAKLGVAVSHVRILVEV